MPAVSQVFSSYVDDDRNTDNAWVDMIVVNIHLHTTSQVLVDVNNVVRTRTSARWDGPSAGCSLTLRCVFLIGHEQRWLSCVAEGELQKQTGLKPERRPALGGRAARLQVLILPTFIPSHRKPSELTHVYLRLQTPRWLLHTTHTCSNTGIFHFQRVVLS